MGLQISETRCPFPNGNNAGTDRLIPLRIFGSRQSTLSFAAGDQTHRRFKADDKLLSFLDKLWLDYWFADAAARATASKPHSGVQASFDRCVGYIGPKMAWGNNRL